MNRATPQMTLKPTRGVKGASCGKPQEAPYVERRRQNHHHVEGR